MVDQHILHTLRTFPKRDWVVWVGAGISRAAPANLPLGLPLTHFVLDQVCGRPVRDRLQEIWQRANDIAGVPGMAQTFGPGPRLETVLGVVEVLEKTQLARKFDFLSALRSLDEAPYNDNHLYLAKLICDGATVITTNFDTCIQRAFSAVAGTAVSLEGKKIGNVYHFASKAPGSGSLWHVHGVAQDVASLGATLRAVKEGLSPDFTLALDQMLSRKCFLVFAGYGAGDSFDVTPYFASKAPGQYAGSCAFFLQHGSLTIPLGADVMVRPFGTRFKMHGDTTNWLKAMAESAITTGYSGSTFTWEDTFLSKVNIHDLPSIRPFAICRLARELGIDYKKLESTAYHQALASADTFEPWEFYRTLAFNCRMRRESSRERRHDREAGDTDLLGYHYSQGNLHKAQHLAKSLDAIVADSSDPNAELDWLTYTSFSAHARPLIVKYASKPFRRRLDARDAAEGRRLLQTATMLADRPLKNVTYLNQVATAMRFSLLLNALVSGEDGKDIEQRILWLYREASSIQGYVSAYRDLAIKRLLLARLYSRRGQLDEAVSCIRKSAELARLIGDVDGIRRARYVGGLVYLGKLGI